MKRANRAALLVLLGAAGAACTRTTELLPAQMAACAAPGPAVHLGGTDAASCTGALAARFGRFALCSCDDLTLTGNLFVNGPGANPGQGPGGGGPGPAAPAPRAFVSSVGTDGNLRVALMTEVGGSLLTAGSGEATFVHGGHVQGNLRGAGSFTTMTTMGVWVSGEMVSGGDVSGKFMVVGGPLHVPAAAAVTAEVQPMSVARETVAVPPPCGCGPTATLDLAAAVAERRTRNANATLPFADDLLTDVEAPATLDLPCGEYYLPGIRTADGAVVELRVHGRVALFVAGDVRLGSNFDVTLDDGAELDLVVAGSFYLTGQVFGSATAPSRTRLWVGSNTISMLDQVTFRAAVFAPGAVFSAGMGLKLSGSLFVGALAVTGDVRLAYDPSVTQGGAACGVAPPPRVE